jgi:threonine/homoserine/homoserine lactone efflux protein
MTVLVFLWDAFIIYVLSQERVKGVFSRIAFYVDKVAGTLLGLIGLKLIESTIFEGRKI